MASVGSNVSGRQGDKRHARADLAAIWREALDLSRFFMKIVVFVEY
jgi:hypothetical protein